MELEILRHIQSISNPFFDFLFQLITICGEQIVLIVIISIIYWALDKKFGEYIAASRAIVTEKLHYEIPGEFKSGINYLEFSSAYELVNSINKLMKDNVFRYKMMQNNHDYYVKYVRPDKLVMNTLKQVIQESEEKYESKS